MSICKDIRFCVIELLHNHRIKCDKKDEEKIITRLTQYAEILIFTMISIACMICVTINIRRMLNEHMQFIEKEINKRCSIMKIKSSSSDVRRMKGGVFNTAAFYGIEEPQYSEANKMGDIMNVDWSKNIARPELKIAFGSTPQSQSGGSGNCDRVNQLISKQILSVLKFYKVSAKQSVRSRFVMIFNRYIEQLFGLLKKASTKQSLTYKKLQSILSRTKVMKMIKK